MKLLNIVLNSVKYLVGEDLKDQEERRRTMGS